MNEILGHPSPWTRAAFVLGLDLMLKATVLCLLIGAFHLALGRRRALVRSALWNACLAGLLLLPLLGAALPRLRVVCLPGRESLAAASPTERTADPLRELPRELTLPRNPTPLDGNAAAELSASKPGNTPSGGPLVPFHPRPSLDPLSALLLGYALGAGLMLLRLGRSLAAVGALRRSGVAVVERPWIEALEHWRGRLGIVRPVGLARSQRIGVPVAVGWLRPTVLLPAGLVLSATPQTIDAVLVHELAHLRRGDYLWNVFFRLVRALYWPHPLIWLIGWISGDVREQACDDACVYWMGGARVYRGSLLDVAAGLVRRPREALGLAMTRSGNLGRRLAWIERSAGAAACLPRWPTRVSVAAAVLAAAGVLGSVELAHSADAHAAPPASAPTVAVSLPRARAIADFEDFTGHISADQVTIRARVSGLLEKVNVQRGAAVKRGDLLFELDPRPFQPALEKARAEVARATARLKRQSAELKLAKNLLAQHVTSREEFEKVEAEWEEAEPSLRVAQAELERARIDLDSTRIMAPLAGEISRPLSAGDFVNAGTTALALLILQDPMYADFDMDERTLLRLRRLLREGKLRKVSEIPALLGLANDEGFPHRGKIDYVDPRVDPGMGTVHVRAVFPNAERILAPGMFARIRIALSDPNAALLVPERAVETDEGRHSVLVVGARNIVERRTVKLGALFEGFRVVKSGLTAQDRVIVSKLKGLRPGMVVTPKQPSK